MRAILDYLWHYLWHRPLSAIMGAVPRSPKWPAVRRAWLKDHPACAVTGATKHVEVHHKIPYSVKPEWELNPVNFITVRRDVHFLMAHFSNWQSYNPDIEHDARVWRVKILARP